MWQITKRQKSFGTGMASSLTQAHCWITYQRGVARGYQLSHVFCHFSYIWWRCWLC
jgi:hypothetical protein